MSLIERLRIEPGSKVSLKDADASDTPDFPVKGWSDEAARAAEKLVAENTKALAALQYELWAEHERAVLIVLQGMDTSGKDGVIRHVFSGVNPQGLFVYSFKQPSTEELDHDFLWRIHKTAPGRGEIVIFNRSHYESVLVERVHELVPEKSWKARYGIINDFERALASPAAFANHSKRASTVIVKFFLHISEDEQLKRLNARLDNPRKNWKSSAGDFEERKRWKEYTEAYEDALSKCSTEEAPWFRIPSDHKWYQRWAISQIVLETLREMAPKIPVGKGKASADITG